LLWSLLASVPVIASAQSGRELRGATIWHGPGVSALRFRRPLAPTHLPESDPNAAGAALTLLVGSVAVLAGKRSGPKA
jgi:hypothetical protein